MWRSYQGVVVGCVALDIAAGEGFAWNAWEAGDFVGEGRLVLHSGVEGAVGRRHFVGRLSLRGIR